MRANDRTIAIAVSIFSGFILACAACDGDDVANDVPSAGAGSGGTAALPSGGAGGDPTQAGAGAGAAGSAGSVSAGAGAGEGGAASSDAGQAGTAGTAPDAAVPELDAAVAPSLPPVESVDGDGPFATSEDLATGPRGDSGMFYPTELGTDGVTHPILVWGCGGGSTPSSYAEVLRRIASHGFVVIAEVSMIGDDGDVLTASLDWIIAENARPESLFFGKLATTMIAAGGHSIGSVNTFFIAGDPRLRTTIHVAGGSLDDVNDPFAPTTGLGGKALIHPTAFICAESDVFGNVEKTEADYAMATAPVFFTIMTGAEHVGAATDGLPAIVAWLRWHLAGETERSAMFLEQTGEFQTGKYVSQIKNW